MKATVPELPTELLLRVFSLLQVTDLLSVQHTCRRFHDVVSDSASLQYFLRTKVNLLEDFMPPHVSLCDRLAILKRHEAAWNNLQLSPPSRFVTNEGPHDRYYILQDGHLIYKAVTDIGSARFGFIDLNSSSFLPKVEANWTHISLAGFCAHWDMVFSVDQNLLVVSRF